MPNSRLSYMSKIILAGIIILVLLGGSFYLAWNNAKKSQELEQQLALLKATLNHQKNIDLHKKETSPAIPTSQKNLSLLPTKIKAVIDQFERYQQDRDPQKVFSLFTPPSTEKEKEDYENLHLEGLYRLYSAADLNYQLRSWKIINFQKASPTYYKVNVEERRDYGWDQTEAKWKKTNVLFRVEFSVVKRGNNWLIDKYCFPNTPADSKYSAFYLEE